MRRAPWAGGVLVFAAFAACVETESYIFSARRYDGDAGCLQTYESLEQIRGSGAASNCAPTCFRFNGAIFTSRVCPPLPEGAELLDQASPECTAANVLVLGDSGCGLPSAAEEEEPDGAVLDASDEGG